MSQITTSPAQKSIRLQNIRTQQQAILQEIAKLVRDLDLESSRSQTVLKQLTQVVARIEQLCVQQQLTPANLSRPSRQVYAWMKFLADESHLLQHLRTTRRIQQLAEEELCSSQILSINKSVAVNSKKLNIELLDLAGLYKYKSSSNSTLLQIHEGFIVAPDEVLVAVIQSALSGKSSVTSRAIRNFSLSEEFSEVLLEMELTVQVVGVAKGQVYDLNTIFELVNREYFASRMPKPRLSWNQVLTRRKFGHYDPARDRVVLSRTLDNRQVPRYVVEFVMYHELLHKQHGEKWEKSRLMFHTPQFRGDERKFKQYKQAQQWLENWVSRFKENLKSKLT